MNKKILAVLGIVLFIILGLGGYYFFNKRNKSFVASPNTLENKTVPSEKPFELAKWEDPLGFTFSYPKELNLNPHDEDMENYAHIELTSGAESGKIIIWAKDTSFLTIEDFIKEDPIATSASSLDTTLANIPAKKINITKPEKKLITATIYDELLFLIETEQGQSDYWSRVNDEIIKNFTFAETSSENSSDGQSSGESYDEGEEVIE